MLRTGIDQPSNLHVLLPGANESIESEASQSNQGDDAGEAQPSVPGLKR